MKLLENIFNYFAEKLHKHTIVIYSRKSVGTEKHVVYGGLETFNVYLCKGVCLECKRRLYWKQKIIAPLDAIQPYDI